MTDRQAAVVAELAALRDAYLARLPQEIVELNTLAADLGQPADARQRLDALHQRLHKLAGSGGTFGLADLSRQAQALESTVQGWLGSDGGAIEAGQQRDFAAAVAALADTLSQRVTSASSPLAGPAHEPTATDDGRRIQVWLVEDDVPLGETLARLLGQFGYDVRLFSRIDAAESAASLARPDILVMDVMFTDEGVNATEALLERPAFKAMDCPIVFISAFGDFESRVRAARLGVEGFLLKPIDVPRLVDRLERALEARLAAPYRVLIVDDDVDLAQHYRLVLAAAGMDVAVLNDPRALINTLSAFHPELVLMDLHMPDYSGPELATVIRHHDEWIGLPIVYLSAETDTEKQLQAMSRGADDFLSKPITDAHLAAAVKVRAERSRQLADLMSKDSLTGLLTHARIKDSLAVELARAQRSGKPLSVAMLDIDHFKLVNDTYGHAVGDRVIKALAHLLKQRLRKVDGIGRYGGEEFVVILPECDTQTAHRVIDDIRAHFGALRFQHEGQEFGSSFSAGVAGTTERSAASGAELLVVADETLYAAKHGGRNQARIAGAAGITGAADRA